MKSILLVDDEAAICVELQRTLQEFGYRVEVAHNFESAIGAICEHEIDIFLIEFNLRSADRNLPRTGRGVDLVRQIRASGKSAPILVLTAMEGDLYRTAVTVAGANELVAKRAPISGLLSCLRNHLRLGE